MNRGEIPETEFYEIKTKAKFKVEEILKLEETLQHDVIAFYKPGLIHRTCIKTCSPWFNFF